MPDTSKFTLKVGTVETYLDHDSGETFQRVPFEILDENGVQLMERHQSFPLTATAEQIRESLQSALSVYREAVERFEQSKEHQAHLDAASETAGEITGLELK